MKKDIDKKYQLDLKKLFNSDEDFNIECNNIDKFMMKIKKYKNHVYDNDIKLYDVLCLDRDISARLEKVYIYSKLQNDLDLSSEIGNKNFGKVIYLYNKYASIAAFLVPELLKKDMKFIKKFILKNNKLREFENNLKEIFRTKKHILNEKEEKIISMFNNSLKTPMSVFNKLINIDLKFEDIKDSKNKKLELSNTNYDSYLESEDKSIRMSAFSNLHNGLKSINNTTTELLAHEINNHNTMTRIRNYSNSIEKALDKNNINPSVYNSLLTAVNKKIKILHKEWELKKKILNIEDYHIYDMSLSIVSEKNIKYDYEDARNLVQGSLFIMGKEYSEILNDIFSKRYIDVYSSKNKRMGAYSTCAYLANPFVLLNYEGTFQDVLTLTHELGHAMHYYYSKDNNTFTNYSYSIFVAEVASQVNEILLLKHMLKKATSKEDKLYILDKFLKRFKLTFATMFADFEKKLHDLDYKNIHLSTEIVNEEYLKTLKKYYGPSVEVDDISKYGWSRSPMFFHDYYLYQYATGYVAALEIAEKIFLKKENAVENYIEFLKLGSTKDPINSLKVTGVDITGTKIYYNALKVFEKTLNEIEKLYYS